MEEGSKNKEKLIQEEERMIEMTEMQYIDDVKALDRTLSKVEGSNRYSRILIIQGMISMFACAYNMFSLGFLNSLPKFYCPVDGEFKLVPEVEACKQISQCRVEYFYEGWVKHYDMLCDNRNSRVFYVSLIFVINAMVFLGLSAIADIFGRNMILKLATLIASVGTFLIYYIDNYGAKIIIFGAVTGTNSIFQMMFTLGLKEAIHSGSDFNIYMNAVLNCAYNAGPIFVAFLAYAIKDYTYLSLSGSLMVILGTVGNFFFFNETPLFLYKKKQANEFIQKLFLLSKINSVTTSKKSILRQLITDEIEFRKKQKLVIPKEGVKKTVILTNISPVVSPAITPPDNEKSPQIPPQAGPIELDDLQFSQLEMINGSSGANSQSKNEKKPHLSVEKQLEAEREQMKEDRNLVWVTVVLCYWCSSLYLVNYGTIISIDKSGMDNLFINAALLGISSVIGYGVCLKFPKNVKRITTISWIIISLLAFSVFILLLDLFSGQSPFIKVVKSICTVGIMPIMVGMGFSVMYLYLPDVYPVTLRGLGIGVVICMGKVFGGACSAYISNFMNQLGLNPIAGCAIPGLVLLALLRTVPDA